ncbi:TioE family transcriptional regulator [Streptomyces sp. NPDC091279]|uniref:TioE family transcriptional regulator n=1 Tax=Streptomyces sp. NPDC091279 TaxID=3365983 RepID=UPI0037F94355
MPPDTPPNPQTKNKAGRLRPIDLARPHGLSTQAIRNYEEAGILPTATRTPHGYRTYTALHATALRTFLALLPGHGHATASSIMRAVNEDEPDKAFLLIDRSHAQLLEDRHTLHAVEKALGALTSTAPPAPPGDTFIGPLAEKLGLRPATLRAWERAGLVHPRRDPRTGYRVYDEAALRDAHLTHQLRRGGYLLHQIAPLITQVHTAGGLTPLQSTLDDWHTRLSKRGRALLRGAAELEGYLRERERERERERGRG